jgi:hypothetical protein
LTIAQLKAQLYGMWQRALPPLVIPLVSGVMLAFTGQLRIWSVWGLSLLSVWVTGLLMSLIALANNALLKLHTGDRSLLLPQMKTTAIWLGPSLIELTQLVFLLIGGRSFVLVLSISLGRVSGEILNELQIRWMTMVQYQHFTAFSGGARTQLQERLLQWGGEIQQDPNPWWFWPLAQGVASIVFRLGLTLLIAAQPMLVVVTMLLHSGVVQGKLYLEATRRSPLLICFLLLGIGGIGVLGGCVFLR